MCGKALLDENKNPTREEVREWFGKHWMACRCTGYKQIVDAVMKAAAILRGEEKIEDLAKSQPFRNFTVTGRIVFCFAVSTIFCASSATQIGRASCRERV